ncbi:397021ee-2729-4c72-b0cf-e7febab95ced [Thermothielavioides terrestris]|uniref:397021ee-2729-4c72-b0cf-e7febab95ced n=1 Tax=Thermothielavioides terrestris TaxID=2587410 RepID=A0A446BR60_9PEZI|nr:397021ee-2729-4c72-b0cf-e7febab95ced [Thermothielavioides terrestris]
MSRVAKQSSGTKAFEDGTFNFLSTLDGHFGLNWRTRIEVSMVT